MAATKISDNDIVFECPSCGQSMAIDQRGEGMLIPCKGCGVEIKVPKRALSSDKKLNTSDFQISRLYADTKKLQEQLENLETLKAQNDEKFESVQKEVSSLLENVKSAN